MPLYAADGVLLNKTNLDSGTDGAGAGTDETASGGRVIDVPERSEIGILAIVKESDTSSEPGDADTLTILVELSYDGGSTYPDYSTSRAILGSEAPDQEDAGDPPLKLGIILKTGEADAAQDGVVKCRLTTTASDTSNWGLWVGVMPVQSFRQEWLDNWSDLAV